MKRTVRTCIFPALALFFLITLFCGGASAGWRSEIIRTVTGKLSDLRGIVLTLDGTETFHPAAEIEIPDWADTGAQVSLSYYRKGNKNFYYEIVKPGEPFAVKDRIERGLREDK